VSLTFHGDEKWSRDAQNDMQMLGEVLRIRLREVLREDMGAVYGVSVGGAVTRRPRQQYRFSIAFGCAPENVAKLEAAVWAEIQEIQDKGIGDDYVAKVKEMRRRAHQTATSENAYWLRELSSAYAFGDDPKGILDFDSFVDKVGSDRVKAAAKKYLAKTQYVLGELRPAARGGATAGP
jgi:zinc protease